MKTQRLVIFSSGSGTNAEKLIQYFASNERIEVVGVYTNKTKAGVVEKAKNLKVPVRIWTNEDFNEGVDVLKALKEDAIDWIVLAGFLRKIPNALLHAYAGKIINIHPSLLPKYGGKGMYGFNVHRAVIENSESESGISIHLVNEVYDEGKTIAQFKTALDDSESLESLEEKIKNLEHKHFAPTVESYILNQK